MCTLMAAGIPLVIAYLCSVPVGIILSIVVAVILLIPVEGFEEKECIKTIPLIPFQEYRLPSEKYVKLREMANTKAYFAYDNRKEYNLNGLAYEEGHVTGNIKIYRSKECKQPVLKVFKTKPVRGDWTFAPFSTKKEYVFYIPYYTEDVSEEFKVTSM